MGRVEQLGSLRANKWLSVKTSRPLTLPSRRRGCPRAQAKPSGTAQLHGPCRVLGPSAKEIEHPLYYCRIAYRFYLYLVYLS